MEWATYQFINASSVPILKFTIYPLFLCFLIFNQNKNKGISAFPVYL